jgi:outer membrane lipoprotein-sorting protein
MSPKTMLRAIVTALACAALHLAQAAPQDAQAILGASDAIRNPNKPFSISVALTEYKDGADSDGTLLTVYSKADASNGQYKSLISYVEPPRDAGKLMLKNGSDLWFYDANSKASIRISPQQRLLGQASNGDVVTVNLAKDYQAKLGGEEDVKDGDQQPRHSYKLDLKASAADATYDRVEMWVDSQTFGPIKGKFYSESGSLLKTAYYRRYQKELEAVRPTETVIIDGLNPKWVTVMRYSDYQFKDIPDAWFQRDFLPHFKAE